MPSLVSGLFVVVLAVQFLLWALVTVDVRRASASGPPELRWYPAMALFPVVGLVVSAWYVLNRDGLHGTGGSGGGRED